MGKGEEAAEISGLIVLFAPSVNDFVSEMHIVFVGSRSQIKFTTRTVKLKLIIIFKSGCISWTLEENAAAFISAQLPRCLQLQPCYKNILPYKILSAHLPVCASIMSICAFFPPL